jgi:hypothetical protein
MSETTANLALPLIAASQAQKHVTHNEALADLDALVQLACLDKDRASPPPDPAEGDRYLVLAANPTGAWTGLSGQIARFQDGHWLGLSPKPGWLAWIVDDGDLYAFSGAAWVSFRATLTVLQGLTRLGIGTAADAANPFAAKLNTALWTALTTPEGGSGDLRYTLNKQAAGNVLSVLFQSGFSGRAELGLTGDDDLTLKVSPDGTAFREALRVNRSTGNLGLGTAAPRTRLDTGLGTLSGAANDYGKAQSAMSGGGTVTWQGAPGRLAWSRRFVCRPMTRATAPVGFVQMPMPTAPIPAAQVHDGVARPFDASGVPLNAWEALWAVHTPGGGPDAIAWFITTSEADAHDFDTPSNWILVAAVNGDDGSVRLGTGAIIPAGGSLTPGIGSFQSIVTSGPAAFGGPVSVRGTVILDFAGDYTLIRNAVGTDAISIGHADAATYLKNTTTYWQSQDGGTTFASLTSTAFAPWADNTFNLGSAARRFSTLYAGTGTINTSDAREKTPVEPLTEAQVAAATALAREIGTFRFLDAVARKGDEARSHVGLTVQRAIEILGAHGLDPFALGMVCHDAWAATEPVPAIEGRAAEYAEDGREIAPAIPARNASPGAPAGERYGFRTDELLLFLARGFDARLRALEAEAH